MLYVLTDPRSGPAKGADLSSGMARVETRPKAKKPLR